MQSKTLLERTGCTEPTFKDWLRKGVILPARPGHGPGTHADYDEANSVALLIGVRMKEAGIIVGNYALAFSALQEWLRASSSLDWQHCVVAMTPQGATFHHIRRGFEIADMALMIPLAPVCHHLSNSVEGQDFYQYSLFGLQAVRKTK